MIYLVQVINMLGTNIKQLRLNKSWTQEELAAHLLTTRQTVSKWENGISVPDANSLIHISELFNVSVSSMLGDSIKEEIDLNEISNKLEVLNSILASKENRFKIFSRKLLKVIMYFILVFIILSILGHILFGAVKFETRNMDVNNVELKD